MSADSAFIVDRDDNGQWVIIRTPEDWPDTGPPNMARFYRKLVDAEGLSGAVVRGDFEVCPISRATADESAHACMQSATHLRRVSREWMSPAQKKLDDQRVAALRRDEERAAAAENRRKATAPTAPQSQAEDTIDWWRKHVHPFTPP